MPQHSETRRLPHSAQQMFELVADVERYPDFLPWCLSLKLHERTPTHLTADMTVGYGIFSDSFLSRVALTPPERIEVIYTSGPFRHLHNRWTFRETAAGGCEVEFYIDFAFKSGLFNRALAPFFTEAVSAITQAFEGRARKLYGNESML